MNYTQFCISSLVSAKRLQLYNSPTTTTRKKNSFYFSLMLLRGDYLTNYYILTDAQSIKQDSSFLQSHTIKGSVWIELIVAETENRKLKTEKTVTK